MIIAKKRINSVDFIEGKDGDFEYGDIDIKKHFI